MPFLTRFANFSSRAISAQSSSSSSGSISDACLLSWLAADADDSCDFIRFALDFLFSLRFSRSSCLLTFSLQAEFFCFLPARSDRKDARVTSAALVDSATATRFASCARSA